jgi:hypothetical protein
MGFHTNLKRVLSEGISVSTQHTDCWTSHMLPTVRGATADVTWTEHTLPRVRGATADVSWTAHTLPRVRGATADVSWTAHTLPRVRGATADVSWTGHTLPRVWGATADVSWTAHLQLSNYKLASYKNPNSSVKSVCYNVYINISLMLHLQW